MLQRCLEYRCHGADSGRRHVTHGHINIDSNDDLTTAIGKPAGSPTHACHFSTKQTTLSGRGGKR
jgi:hypothetical protein